MTNILFHLLFISVITNAGPATPSEPAPVFVPVPAVKWESEATRFWISKPLKVWKRGANEKCYIYDSYWVKTRLRMTEVGENVYVFKRSPDHKVDFPGDCDMDTKKASFTLEEYAEYFSAIVGDRVFIDGGTSTWRGLTVYSLKDGKKLAETGYQISGEFTVKGDEMIYVGPLWDEDMSKWPPSGPCVLRPGSDPESYTQKDYSGTVIIDLITGKERVEKVSCEFEMPHA